MIFFFTLFHAGTPSARYNCLTFACSLFLLFVHHCAPRSFANIKPMLRGCECGGVGEKMKVTGGCACVCAGRGGDKLRQKNQKVVLKHG